MLGIVNGTTNYILTRMSEDGATYGEALAEAQSLGYAERDPTADVEGYDAGAKAAIIATIAFGVRVVAGDVYHEGISGITPADIKFAQRLGYEVKLLAIAEADIGDDGVPDVAVRVHPAMVPAHHPLASVRGQLQRRVHRGRRRRRADVLRTGRRGRADGQRGAGRRDRRRRQPAPGHATPRVGALARARIRPIDDVTSAYYLNLDVADQPGVLAQVAGVFGRHGVSIRSMEQEGLGDEARLIFITHEAVERDVQATLHDLRELDPVDRVGTVLRVIGDDA